LVNITQSHNQRFKAAIQKGKIHSRPWAASNSWIEKCKNEFLERVTKQVAFVITCYKSHGNG